MQDHGCLRGGHQVLYIILYNPQGKPFVIFSSNGSCLLLNWCPNSRLKYGHGGGTMLCLFSKIYICMVPSSVTHVWIPFKYGPLPLFENMAMVFLEDCIINYVYSFMKTRIVQPNPGISHELKVFNAISIAPSITLKMLKNLQNS